MDKIIQKLRKFNADREWSQFHTPKNLVMALMVEVAELAEVMQWKTESQCNELMRGLEREHITEEIADIFIYALILADKFNLDIDDIILKKIRKNEVKYPVKKFKGSSRKYNE